MSDTIKLEVEINVDTIRSVAQRAADASFTSDPYRGDNFGYVTIKAAVAEAVRAIDFAPYVREAIEAELRPAVIDAVRARLKTEARAAVKAEMGRREP